MDTNFSETCQAYKVCFVFAIYHVLKLIFIRRLRKIYHNNFLPPPPPNPPAAKFCITIVFSLAFALESSKEKLKTMVMKNWGGGWGGTKKIIMVFSKVANEHSL